MATYRVDIVGPRGQVCFHANFVAADDDEARATAARLFPSRRMELYQGTRRVGAFGTVPAREPPQDMPDSTSGLAMRMYR